MENRIFTIFFATSFWCLGTFPFLPPFFPSCATGLSVSCSSICPSCLPQPNGWKLFFWLLVHFPTYVFVKNLCIFWRIMYMSLFLRGLFLVLYSSTRGMDFSQRKEGRWKEELGWDERAWNVRGRCQLKKWTPLHPPLDRWGEWSWQPFH